MSCSQPASRSTKRSVMDNALGAEFEPFLYATIGGSSDETPVSVLSALARQNVDPWAEAAALARLPGASAIARLIPAIVAVSSVTADPDAAHKAARLIALLPHSVSFIPRYNRGSPGQNHNFTRLIIYRMIGVMMIVSAAFGI